MSNSPELIVMLTHNDRTVRNAFEVFEQNRHSKAEIWGFKEEGIPFEEMKRLFSYMKSCGKTTALEVVAYTPAECLKGAQMAVDCGCDILMGTMYSDAISELCQQHHIRYMPFVGKITGRPSVLDGSIDEIINEAKTLQKKGVYGIDLLGYRFAGNATELNRRLVAALDCPVCLAGSINSIQRLDEVKMAAPWAFTIGSAFFEGKFGDDFTEQINKVCAYMRG